MFTHYLKGQMLLVSENIYFFGSDFLLYAHKSALILTCEEVFDLFRLDAELWTAFKV